MATTLHSPKENVASKELIAVQNTTTRIKELIIIDVDSGVSKEETTKKIAKIIAELDKTITDKILLKEAKQSIALSTQRWYYEYSANVKLIREALKTNINHALTRYINSNVAVKNKTYTVDFQNIINEIKGVNSNNEFTNVFEKFRPYIDDATKGLPVIDNYDKLVKGQIKVLASNPPISNRVTKNGKPYKVSLRNRAEMFVRYSANKEDLQNLINEGVDLVWISSHADASLRCSKYQGKLYSISGKTGTVDGIRYTPLDNALKGPLGDGNGCISGYNCRHRLIEYTPKSKPPNDYSHEEMQKAYKIDSRQRQYENHIRELKTEERLYRASGDIEIAKKLRLKWRRLNKNYEIFSVKNGRAFYTWRTRISDDEGNNNTLN